MIKQKVKSIINKVILKDYHLNHKKNAISILKKIEVEKGKTNPKHLKLCNQYAADVLGWTGYSPWLYVYTAIAGDFKEGWIPDNYYGKIVVPSLKGGYGEIDDLKSLNNKIFKSNLFPDIAYYANGLWTSNNYAIVSEKNIKELLFKKSKKIVYKIDNSLQGLGVYFFTRENFEVTNVTSLGNGIVQEYIKQHKFFEEIMPQSVATIRLTTFIDKLGIVSLRAAYLRIGRTSDSHVKSATHIRIPIDIETGELYENGYNTNWNSIEKHPDTNFIFKKKQIPNFNDCINSAFYLHKLIPFVRTIGWDMVIDEKENVKVMEWNGTHNDIKFSEATQGPCFSGLGWENLWQTD